MRAPATMKGNPEWNVSERLAHSIWDCKYRVVWIPKYQRKELYGKQREVVIRTIRKWARIKEVEILEGHAARDHIHLCL